MKILHILFAISLICIVPCMAESYSGTAPAGQAIWALDIKAGWGTSGGYVLTLENGNTVTGTWDYGGLLPPTFEASIGSDSSTYTYVAPLPVNIQIWNGDNVTYERELKLGYGQYKYKGGWNDVLITQIAASPVTSYSVSSTGAIEVVPEFIDYSTAVTNLNYRPDDWIGRIKEYLPMLWGAFEALMYWLNLLFVENLVLTVSLYMAGSMAYAANTSRNMFLFYKTWFGQQKAIFEFMAQGFLTTIQIITTIVNTVTSVVGAIASKILGLL